MRLGYERFVLFCFAFFAHLFVFKLGNILLSWVPLMHMNVGPQVVISFVLVTMVSRGSLECLLPFQLGRHQHFLLLSENWPP
jgi:hypothetical protein